MKPWPETIDAFLLQAQGNPRAIFRVAALLRPHGDQARATDLYCHLLAQDDLDAELAVEIRRFLSGVYENRRTRVDLVLVGVGHRFPEPVETVAGEPIRVRGTHDCRNTELYRA